MKYIIIRRPEHPGVDMEVALSRALATMLFPSAVIAISPMQVELPDCSMPKITAGDWYLEATS